MSTYRAVPCRSCERWVIWAFSEAGNRMPVDAKPSPKGTVDLVPRPGSKTPTAVVVPPEQRSRKVLRTAHHATCPQGDTWRRS